MANTVVSVSYVGDATTSVMRSWGTCADAGSGGSTKGLTAAVTTATANAAIQRCQECRFTVVPPRPPDTRQTRADATRLPARDHGEPIDVDDLGILMMTRDRSSSRFGRGISLRALIALTVLVTIAIPGCDWTQRLGGLTHGSRTSDTGLTAARVATLQEQWRFKPGACNGVTTGAVWFATPVTFHGVIYIGDDYGCLHAIDEATGHVLWTRFHVFVRSTTCGQPLGIVSSINVQDDGAGNPVLYFHSPDGYLYKLRGSNGATIWKSLVQIPSSTENDVYAWSSPTVANGKVIVGISSNCDVPFVQGQVRRTTRRPALSCGRTRRSPTGSGEQVTGTTRPSTPRATCTSPRGPPTTRPLRRIRTRRRGSSSTRSSSSRARPAS